MVDDLTKNRQKICISIRGRRFQNDLKNRFYFILKLLYILTTIKILLCSTLALKEKCGLIIKMGSRFATNVPFQDVQYLNRVHISSRP